MDSVEWYKFLLKKKKELKKIKLVSTSGLDETIAVVLSDKDKNEGRQQYLKEYRQRPEVIKHRKQYLKEYRQRPVVKKHHKKYVREWNRKNPDKVKAITKRHNDKLKNQKSNKNRRRTNNNNTKSIKS